MLHPLQQIHTHGILYLGTAVTRASRHLLDEVGVCGKVPAWARRHLVVVQGRVGRQDAAAAERGCPPTAALLHLEPWVQLVRSVHGAQENQPTRPDQTPREAMRRER